MEEDGDGECCARGPGDENERVVLEEVGGTTIRSVEDDKVGFLL